MLFVKKSASSGGTKAVFAACADVAEPRVASTATVFARLPDLFERPMSWFDWVVGLAARGFSESGWAADFEKRPAVEAVTEVVTVTEVAHDS